MFCDYTDKNGKPYTMSYKCWSSKEEECCPMAKQCVKNMNDAYGYSNEPTTQTAKIKPCNSHIDPDVI